MGAVFKDVLHGVEGDAPVLGEFLVIPARLMLGFNGSHLRWGQVAEFSSGHLRSVPPVRPTMYSASFEVRLYCDMVTSSEMLCKTTSAVSIIVRLS